MNFELSCASYVILLCTLLQTTVHSCAADELIDPNAATVKPNYVTLKMSPDSVHADLVQPKDVRDRRIAELEKRVTKLEHLVKALQEHK